MGRVSHVAPGAAHSAKDKDIAMECMQKLQISHLDQRKFMELSGGEKQMVLVARAMTQQAKYLIMDEPTANLDYSNQIKILKTIKDLAKQDYGILMTSHYPDHAFLACSEAILIRDGVIMHRGSAEDVVTTENLTQLYDAPVVVSQAQAQGNMVKVCVPLIDKVVANI